MARWLIGTSGWSYKDWRGVFYPEKIPPNRWIEHYAGQFPVVELNASFYRLPSKAAVDSWMRRTPPGFRFAVKGSRTVTHIKRLKDAGEQVARLAEVMAPLGDKLACFLWQLPPTLKKDLDLLEAFLCVLPEGSGHVVEFREPGWLGEDTDELLRRYGVSNCAVSSERMPARAVFTGKPAYVRFHGLAEGYKHLYTARELSAWAQRIARLAAEGHGGLAFFNNDYKGRAIQNARDFRRLLLEKGVEVPLKP